jgi:hypothetical protein
MLAPDTPSRQRCGACGKEFARNLTGRRKRYCSAGCRLEAHRAFKFSISGHDTRVKRNDAKSPCGPRGNSGENRGRGSGIHGPRHVIEAEIGGGNWAEVFSADGVRSFVTQIRPAALIEARQRRAQP